MMSFRSAKAAFWAGIIVVLASPAAWTQENDLQNLRQQRTDVLRYGIDAEVITLLNTLKAERAEDFNDLILQQAAKSVNQDLIAAALDLFAEQSYPAAGELARNIIKEYDLYRNPLILSTLAYLRKNPSPENIQAVLPLLSTHNSAVLRGAVENLGASQTEAHVNTLLDLFDNSLTPDEVKTAIIAALGSLGFDSAAGRLREIAVNEDERAAFRWYAVQALGKIGDPASFAALRGLLGDPDPNLRSYVVEAVGRYPDGEEVLIEALRDSFWRVRVSAARQLGERQAKGAVEILIYKARSDPENNVKYEAIVALGKIGEGEGFDFLRELAASRTAIAPTVWAQAVQTLVEHDLRPSLEIMAKIIEEEYAVSNSYFLNHLGRLLSEKADAAYLADIYGLFMDHPNLVIKIYGIRGAQLNHLTRYRDRITELSAEGQNNSVRQAALRALENL